MSYAIPTDIPQVVVTWLEWPLAERLRAAFLRDDAPVWSRLAAVAISLNEQPGKIPNGNCCGIMSQGRTMPWGWREKHWQRVKPVGYALIREGQGGLLAPFLAFAQPADSLSFLIDRVWTRRIWTGEDYAAEWVSINVPASDGFKSAAAAYERAYDKAVAALWAMARRGEDVPRTGDA